MTQPLAAFSGQSSSVTEYLSQLNAPQRLAVEHTHGPLLVFAGAGSGKTRVLTYRILHLVNQGLAAEHEILAVTFTNKAASEMKERVATLLGAESCQAWVSTFHSTCVRILRQHAALLGYTSKFAIYDRADSLAAIKRVMKFLRIDPRLLSPRSVLTELDRAKNSYIDPEEFRAIHSQQYSWDERMYELYKGYQEELLRANAMDFGDLLCNTVSLLSLNPTLCRSYQQQFKFILVDEYQDTNKVQYLLIQKLAELSRNLCVVGDDDQSIYAFRGATIDNILNFESDFPDAVSVTLDINYRSTKHILQAANAVIARNTRRQKKTLITENPTGNLLTGYRADDERDEARFVCSQIQRLAAEGYSLSDMAIFYRTNAQSRAFEEECTQIGIPFRIFGGVRFYERREVRDILSYLRLLANSADNESFLRVINTPARGIGSSSIQKILEYASDIGENLYTTVTQLVSSGLLGKAATKKCKVFVELYELLLPDYQRAEAAFASGTPAGDSLSSLLHAIAEKSGYLQELRDENTEESLGRIENLNELFSVAQEFVVAATRDGLAVSLQDFLDRTSLISDLDRENSTHSVFAEGSGAVSMMTLHLAKGLEFRCAFLVGLEDGLLPHVRSLDSRAALEEERRLCYVGITRGKEQVFLTRCSQRGSGSRGSGWSSGLASRFIGDIPPEIIDDCGSFIECAWDF